jgi:hypothetical protein
MSRSNQNEGKKNPSTRWFEWASKLKTLSYWDGDKKENVAVELPFTFLVLDELNTISGFHNEDNSRILANEVRNLKTEPLVIRTHKRHLTTAFYDEVKGHKDYRFAKSIYVAYYDDSELKLGNIKLLGSAFTAWVDFSKANKIYEGAVTISRADKKKNKAVEFFVPHFEIKKAVSEETEEKAKELDRTLQAYLSSYMEETSVDATEMRLTAPKDDLVPQWKMPTQGESPFVETEEDDDDIPF